MGCKIKAKSKSRIYKNKNGRGQTLDVSSHPSAVFIQLMRLNSKFTYSINLLTEMESGIFLGQIQPSDTRVAS
jgi:hypothetical protein